VFATLVTHYWSHDGFLTGENTIAARIGEIAHVPAALIHGRRDISGPAIIPWELHQRWPASSLTIVEDEAHGGNQQMAELTAALDDFGNL
jgi:proline iminopeptidase